MSLGNVLVALGGACLICAATALADGNPDQVNDPSPTNGLSCSIAPMYQSFTPSRRLLAAVDLRLGIGLDFPASGFEAHVQVRRDSIDGPVVGTSVAFLGPGLEANSQVLAHFDFTPAAVLDPPGRYFIEWAAPSVRVLYWFGVFNGAGYAGGDAWLCMPFGSTHVFEITSLDLNFITYTPPDSSPPDTAIIIQPDSVPVRDPEVEIEFEGHDDLSYPENLTFECAVDGGGFAPCNDGFLDLKAGRDGAHTVRVRAIDESQTRDPTPATATWIVDRTPPSVQLVRLPDVGAFLSFRIDARDKVDSSAQLKLLGSIDARPFTPIRSTFRIPKARRPHRIRVVAVDRAGNRSPVALLVVASSA